jgi:hypothetical protein
LFKKAGELPKVAEIWPSTRKHKRHHTCGFREWPFPEEEKKPNSRGFGQYKPLKGHKHDKKKIERQVPLFASLQSCRSGLL